MRFPTLVAIIVFVLVVGWVGPLHAKGGKGGGGGHGKGGGGGGGQVSHGGGKSHGGGSAHKPQKDKFANEEKVAKEDKVKSPKEDKVAKDKVAKDKAKKEHDSDVDADEGDEDGDVTTGNKKEKQLANFQRQRDKKLAQAEHLRQIAERNGNANLLANADRMETQAQQEYVRKVQHLEKFGVTDPELDLDGDGFADPWTPDVDPLDDPLAEPQHTHRSSFRR